MDPARQAAVGPVGRGARPDPRFEHVGACRPNYRRATRIGVRGVLYEKTG